MKYVVTSYTPGLIVNKAFLRSLKGYCRRKQAKLLIMLTAAAEDAEIAPEIQVLDVVQDVRKLNKNLSILPIETRPTAANPLASLERIGRRDCSTIIPATSLHLNSIPSIDSLPNFQLTTGSVCLAGGISKKKSAVISCFDHACCAIVIEIESEKFFHFRHLECDTDGSFFDLGERFFGDRSEQAPPAACLLGDPHAGEHDEAALDITLDVLKKIKVKEILCGDLFSGASVSHHEIDDKAALLKRFEAGQHLLERELQETARIIQKITQVAPLKILHGNHENWLTSWLDWPENVVPIFNYKIFVDLKANRHSTKNLLKHALEKFGGLKGNSKVSFLEKDVSYKIQDCEMGYHGDLGPRGALKPSAASLEKGFLCGSFGHFHAAKILRKIWVAGSLMNLKPAYAKGPSDWSHCSILVYKTRRGRVSRQLLFVTNNKCFLDHSHSVKERASSKAKAKSKAA